LRARSSLSSTRIAASVPPPCALLDACGREVHSATRSDAVRILLTRTAKEGALPIELLSNSEAHDAWFRAKVREALEDKRPDVDDATVEARFAERRASALRPTSPTGVDSCDFCGDF
jgi:DNA-damage-inducible protein J